MGYREAVDHLDALGIDAMKGMAPSLHRMEALCKALDDPQRSVPAIHVAGTNGKTSVARIATSLLTATGLSVAVYTSPHLETVRERLALGDEPISQEDFGALFDHLRPYLELVEGRLGERLTYFEILTAMFFLWAAERPADALVVEVGLGGRWDATNVMDASVAALTNIALDHVRLLGSTREEIAGEKAGVVKRGSVVVTGERSPSVLDVIAREARAVDAPLSVLGRDFHVTENRIALGGRYLSLQTTKRAYEGLYLPLHGGHQGHNAAVALEAVTRFLPARTLDDDVVSEGLGATRLPGRLETIRAKTETSPQVLLDVAHNPDGMSALVTALAETFAFERVTFVFGVLADKDYGGMLAEMARLPCRLLVAAPASGRAVAAGELKGAARERGLDCDDFASVPRALARALDETRTEDLVCATGSHYLVGEARSWLGEGNSDR